MPLTYVPIQSDVQKYGRIDPLKANRPAPADGNGSGSQSLTKKENVLKPQNTAK